MAKVQQQNAPLARRPIFIFQKITKKAHLMISKASHNISKKKLDHIKPLQHQSKPYIFYSNPNNITFILKESLNPPAGLEKIGAGLI